MLALLVASSLCSSLDPFSLPQQLAYYELYPDTQEGQACLERAAALLGRDPSGTLHLPDLHHLVDRFTQPCVSMGTTLSETELALIEQLAADFPHRTLKGHSAQTVDEVLALPSEQIDLARGLLLTYLGEGKEAEVRSYEALLDLMALQVRARKGNPIDAINHLLFFELELRFPPQSRFEEEIDAFTFLPSVLDARRGVCLGVSSLYLCLAQRLGLELEAVTPPGHIFVRQHTKQGVVNIETTARGVHIPTEEYLTLELNTLPVRDLKQVIGLTFMNQGAALWQAGDTPGAIKAYKTAQQFLPEEPLICEFLAYNLLAAQETKEAYTLLKKARAAPNPSSAVEDLLDEKADLAGIEAVYQRMGQTRDSILAKKAALEQTVTRQPKFRAGWFHLALTWLELGRQNEALCALKKYHAIDPTDPMVEYLLAAISMERHDLPGAWYHFRQAEALATNPRPLADLRRTLKLRCPPPALVD